MNFEINTAPQYFIPFFIPNFVKSITFVDINALATIFPKVSNNKTMDKIMNNFNQNPIKTEAEYQTALQQLDIIFDAKKDTPEGDELELLSHKIEVYESENVEW